MQERDVAVQLRMPANQACLLNHEVRTVTGYACLLETCRKARRSQHKEGPGHCDEVHILPDMTTRATTVPNLQKLSQPLGRAPHESSIMLSCSRRADCSCDDCNGGQHPPFSCMCISIHSASSSSPIASACAASAYSCCCRSAHRSSPSLCNM